MSEVKVVIPSTGTGYAHLRTFLAAGTARYAGKGGDCRGRQRLYGRFGRDAPCGVSPRGKSLLDRTGRLQAVTIALRIHRGRLLHSLNPGCRDLSG